MIKEKCATHDEPNPTVYADAELSLGHMLGACEAGDHPKQTKIEDNLPAHGRPPNELRCFEGTNRPLKDAPGQIHDRRNYMQALLVLSHAFIDEGQVSVRDSNASLLQGGAGAGAEGLKEQRAGIETRAHDSREQDADAG